ncbi:AraC family transcriptional regulator [Flammeovirga sp. EKP202]|uniref:helix-turn-helix domain-containing protein n=1 Tax=Flammeovirga sp. EKP202 TaxID=2770592 RepID=UPI00165FD349|nr:helix-turn-helix domain-containing protein [Flammeovirga sp. EKP202]MBD0403932.1 helix-turn-helix transcriptional regulator [Flammeovirga sp. EKP202]
MKMQEAISFNYQGRPLIEKNIFKVPYTKERVFQNEGCFLYMKDAHIKLHSPQDNLEVKKKEAILLRCDTYFLEFLHKQKEQESVEVIAVHLFPELLKKLYINELPKLIEKQMSNPKTRIVEDEAIIARFIDSLEFYFDNPSLVNEDLLELKIKELVLLLIQTNNVSSVMELINDLYSPRTSQLKKVIELHTFSNLSLEDLAKLCHLSLSSFKREFQKVYDETPSKYLSIQRIKKAKELLQSTTLPINEIAYDVGYNDPLYFTRIFKKKEGVSPSQYRNANS